MKGVSKYILISYIFLSFFNFRTLKLKREIDSANESCEGSMVMEENNPTSDGGKRS